MGKKKRVIKKERVPMSEQDPQARVGNFEEVPLGYTPEQAMEEAARCLQCKKPKCVGGCPVGIDIPGFIGLIAEGKFAEAARKIKEANCLPAVCGRVCPQEAQCEADCVLGKKFEPGAIGRLERFAADYEREHGLVELPETASPTGKKVAVVGSGPAGLTVAGDLILLGHEVTVFEAFHKPGGVLMYGIPEFRLPKRIVEEEVDYLRRLGVKIELNQVIGKSITVDELMEEEGYDAVFIGVGAGLPYFMNTPGENLGGVYSASEYLTRANLMKAYAFPQYDTPVVVGRNVCVIGGGNVAMDAARTARRLGAQNVTVLYRRSRAEMPARAEEIHHAEQEGIVFKLLCAPLEYMGDENGMVQQARCQEMELGEPDESGRRRPVPKPGAEFTIDTDLVIVAIGSGANPLLTKETEGLDLNRRGYIAADQLGRTSRPCVWAGGDIVTGSATVILAMGAGKTAAADVHKYLGSTAAPKGENTATDSCACLDTILSSFEGRRDELIPILQRVQEAQGYLSEEALRQIARFARVPESAVYAVATFYAQFRFTPIGKTHIMVCRGTACHVRGGTRILEALESLLGIKEGETTEDLEYTLETVACIGACGLSPCIMANKKVEAKLTPKKVAKLFRKTGNGKAGNGKTDKDDAKS